MPRLLRHEHFPTSGIPFRLKPLKEALSAGTFVQNDLRGEEF